MTDKVVVTQACPDCHGVGEHHPACSFALPHPLDAALTPPVTDLEGLIERLLRTSHRFVSRKGFRGSEEYHVNPDGPEAAAALSRLEAEKRELVEALEKIDREVSHGKMGDWSLALRSIRETCRSTLSKLTGDQP